MSYYLLTDSSSGVPQNDTSITIQVLENESKTPGLVGVANFSAEELLAIRDKSTTASGKITVDGEMALKAIAPLRSGNFDDVNSRGWVGMTYTLEDAKHTIPDCF